MVSASAVRCCVGAGHVGAGQRLAGPDVVGQRRLEGVGVLGQQCAEPGLEEPRPQRPERVVGPRDRSGHADDDRAPASGQHRGRTPRPRRPPRRRPRTRRRGRREQRHPDAAQRAPDRGANADPGPAATVGTRGSGPASTDSSSATSLDVAGQRAADRGGLPEVVVRPLGHPPERRPQPDHAAERGRVAQRAAHVAAVGERHHPCGEGRGRSPAATRRRSDSGRPGCGWCRRPC